MLSTWPAVRTVIDGSWALRLSGDRSRRANSLNILDPDDVGDTEDRLDWALSLYENAGAIPTVRVTPLTPRPVVRALDARGFDVNGETQILVRDDIRSALATWSSPGKNVTVSLLPEPTEDFIAFKNEHTPIAPDRQSGYRQILNSHIVPVRFLEVRTPSRELVHCLVVGLHRNVATVHDVMTHPAFRRKGLGRSGLLAAFGWAVGEGARLAWIGVEATNEPAVNLYLSLGFREAYRYHYRRPSQS